MFFSANFDDFLSYLNLKHTKNLPACFMRIYPGFFKSRTKSANNIDYQFRTKQKHKVSNLDGNCVQYEDSR